MLAKLRSTLIRRGRNGPTIGMLWEAPSGHLHFAYARDYLLDLTAAPLQPLDLPFSLVAYSSESVQTFDGPLRTFTLSIPGPQSARVCFEVTARRFAEAGVAKPTDRPTSLIEQLVWTSFFGAMPDGPAGLFFDPTEVDEDLVQRFAIPTHVKSDWIKARATLPPVEFPELKNLNFNVWLNLDAGLPLVPMYDPFYSRFAPLPGPGLFFITDITDSEVEVQTLWPRLSTASGNGTVRKLKLERSYLRMMEACGIRTVKHDVAELGHRSVSVWKLPRLVPALTSTFVPPPLSEDDRWVGEITSLDEIVPPAAGLLELSKRMASIGVAFDHDEAWTRFLFARMAATLLDDHSGLMVYPEVRELPPEHERGAFFRADVMWRLAPVARVSVCLIPVRTALKLKKGDKMGLISIAARELEEEGGVPPEVGDLVTKSVVQGLRAWGKIAKADGLNDTEETNARPVATVAPPPGAQSSAAREGHDRALGRQPKRKNPLKEID